MPAKEASRPAHEGSPRFLTVEEAAAILRIGRTAAYAAARRWLTTSGKEGLHVVRVGKSLRVPTAAIERMAQPLAAHGTVDQAE